MQLLSQNAIVHISAGFQGPFIVQVFSVKRDLYRRGSYNFCITDGQVYAGGRFECAEDIGLQNYHLVQITAKFFDRFQPITITSLEVVSTALRKLAGRVPCTLQDYFSKQTKNSIYESPVQKKNKYDQGYIKQGSSSQKGPNKEQYSKYPVINLQNDKRQLKLASQSQQEQQSYELPRKIINDNKNKYYQNNGDISMMYNDVKGAQKNSPYRQRPKQKPKQKTCLLKQLIQRASGWVVLCRINYMSIVQCQNGLFAVNFIVSDQVGTQMKCVYFVSQVQTARQTLIIGNYYLLTGGEVKYVLKQKQLQITFDRTSDIILQRGVYFPPIPGKFKRIQRILDEQHGSIVNVVGVIRRIRTRQQFKNKIKFTSTLCDPINHVEVDFMLFLNNGQKEIAIGMIVILHNFQVFRQQNIYRLNSTYKSYYFQQKSQGDSTDLISQIYTAVHRNDWNNQNYRNISMFAFTQRTINQLRQISKRTDDDRLYSSLDVRTLDVVKKKSYQACKNCKRPADKKQMGLYECIHCKRMVDTITTHALSVTFADSTASCLIDVIGQHAQHLLGMKANQFNQLSSQDQANHLQSLKYKNVTVRLKTQKKSDKKDLGQSVWGIQKAQSETVLREIKRRLQLSRMRYEESW